MNGLKDYLEQLIVSEGIAKDFEITVQDKRGRSHHIPIVAIIDFLTSLKQELRVMVYKKFVFAQRKESDLIPVFNQLAIPMVNRRI